MGNEQAKKRGQREGEEQNIRSLHAECQVSLSRVEVPHRQYFADPRHHVITTDQQHTASENIPGGWLMDDTAISAASNQEVGHSTENRNYDSVPSTSNFQHRNDDTRQITDTGVVKCGLDDSGNPVSHELPHQQNYTTTSSSSSVNVISSSDSKKAFMSQASRAEDEASSSGVQVVHGCYSSVPQHQTVVTDQQYMASENIRRNSLVTTSTSAASHSDILSYSKEKVRSDNFSLLGSQNQDFNTSHITQTGSVKCVQHDSGQSTSHELAGSHRVNDITKIPDSSINMLASCDQNESLKDSVSGENVEKNAERAVPLSASNSEEDKSKADKAILREDNACILPGEISKCSDVYNTTTNRVTSTPMRNANCDELHRKMEEDTGSRFKENSYVHLLTEETSAYYTTEVAVKIKSSNIPDRATSQTDSLQRAMLQNIEDFHSERKLAGTSKPVHSTEGTFEKSDLDHVVEIPDDTSLESTSEKTEATQFTTHEEENKAISVDQALSLADTGDSQNPAEQNDLPTDCAAGTLEDTIRMPLRLKGKETNKMTSQAEGAADNLSDISKDIDDPAERTRENEPDNLELLDKLLTLSLDEIKRQKILDDVTKIVKKEMVPQQEKRLKNDPKPGEQSEQHGGARPKTRPLGINIFTNENVTGAMASDHGKHVKRSRKTRFSVKNTSSCDNRTIYAKDTTRKKQQTRKSLPNAQDEELDDTTSNQVKPTLVECIFLSEKKTNTELKKEFLILVEKTTKKRFTFQLSTISRKDDRIVRSLMNFPSRAQARNFCKVIKTAGCPAIKLVREMRLELQKHDVDPKKNLVGKLMKQANTFLREHTRRMQQCDDQLREVQSGKPDGQWTEKKFNVEALQAKMKELRAQEAEFNSEFALIKKRMMHATQGFNQVYLECQILLKRECTKLFQALPLYAYRKEVLNTIQKNQVSVLLGETGSGKSTQVPIYLLEAGFGDKKPVVCTQPRKVAAMALAKHVTKDCEFSLGKEIGYRIGRDERKSKSTKLLYMTDHSLLNECIKDPSLSQYSVVIIDEAHERSIYTDLLLGMLRNCLEKRPDLKIVITSATIDPAVFVEYFGGSEKCPVIRVPGRLFPVDVVYNIKPYPPEYDHVQEAVKKAVEIHHSSNINGDILIFLATPAETERACGLIEQKLKGVVDGCAMQLHGRLQPTEQQAVFNPLPNGQRKIVFATNVAETSVTIPGIHVVIDSGLAKDKKYDAKRNMGVLELDTISQSSADQRKGRAGRTGPGRCFRLYTENEYKAMNPMSRPEIFRVHLGHALLKLMELGISDPLQFKFVESPPEDALLAAMNVLEEIGAVLTTDKSLTDLGRKIAKISLEPRLGKAILLGLERGIGMDILPVAAYTSIGSSAFYRGGTPEANKISDQHKMQFCSEFGDLLTFLNVYKAWNNVVEKEKGKWCVDNSINGKVMKLVRDQVHELRYNLKKESLAVVEPNFTENEELINTTLPHIFFECFPTNLCRFSGHSRAGYIIVNSDLCVHIHPGSSLKSVGSTPSWIVYGQLMKTSQDFAVNVTPVSDEIIEKMIHDGLLEIDMVRLQKKILEPCTMENLSPHMLKVLAGPRHQTRKQLQEELSHNCNGCPVEIHLDFDRGMAVTYIPIDFHPAVYTVLGGIVQSEQGKLRNEREKHPTSAERAGTTALLVEGGKVQEIIMSHEFNTFIFDCKTEGVTEKMLNKMKFLGDLYSFETKRHGARFSTTVEFTETEMAMKGFEQLNQEPDVDVYTGRQFQSTCPGVENQQYQVKLSWTRRAYKGTAAVKFEQPNSTREVFRMLADKKPNSRYPNKGKEVQIGTYTYRILYPKDEQCDLMILNVNQERTMPEFEKKLKRLLRDVCPDTPVKEVRFPRNPCFETSPRQKDEYENRIATYLAGIAQNFTIDVPMPKKHSVDLLCWVTLGSAAERDAVMDRMFFLKLDERFDGDIRRTVCGSVFVTRDMMKVVKEDLDKLLAVENEERENSFARANQMRSQSWRINITSDSIENLIAYKSKIENVIAPTKIDCPIVDGRKHQLMEGDSKEVLEKTATESNTYILRDTRNQIVVIYGTLQNRTRAIQLIEDYLASVSGTLHESYILNGKEWPIGMLKTLLRAYGVGLDKLKDVTKVQTLNLDLRRHSLTARGDENAMTELRRILNEQVEALGTSVGQDGETVDCNVCLCPVAEDIYRLLVCGHAYCKACAADLVTNAIENNNIPILCCSDGCGEAFVLKDLKYLLEGKMSSLIKSAINCYITANKGKVQPCPTADCPTLYRRTKESGSFTCPACQVHLCTGCGQGFHQGLTCKQNKDTLYDDKLMDKWMMQDLQNRAKCPSCLTPIEKNDGCQHMTCIACKSHICWRCKSLFKTANECYAHLARNCGGIF